MFTFLCQINAEIKEHDFDAPVPINLKQTLDEHAKDVANVSVTYRQTTPPEWLPGWLVKYDSSRIEGAKEFAKTIDEMKSKKLFIPRKFSYQVPKDVTLKPWDTGRRTIAEFIPDSQEPFTKEDLKEVMRFSKKREWIDPHKGNLIKTPDGRIAITDTKPQYINASRQLYNPQTIKWLIINKVYGLNLDSDAREYATQKYQEYNPEYQKWTPYIKYLKRFTNYLNQQFAIN
jgi:hypothetical protein